MRRSLIASTLFAAACVFAAPAHAVDLTGQSVTATFSFLGSNGSTVQFVSPQIVGPGVEFTGTDIDVFGQSWRFDLDVTATGFSIDLNNGVNGNIRSGNTNDIIRFDLSGLSGIGPISFVSYSCDPPGSFACGVDNGGPSLNAIGSDATSAFVRIRSIRNGERYVFSLGEVVPEPATWAMMIAGFGMAGAAFRRRTARIAYA